VVAAGSPATVLTAPLIEAVYAARVRVIAGDDGHPVIAPVRQAERDGRARRPGDLPGNTP
jgi:hypothetical protein